MVLVVCASVARLRGPYRKVSCKPKLFAVSWIEADLGAEDGTMRNEGSCDQVIISCIICATKFLTIM